MASTIGSALQEALSSLRQSPMDSGYGIASQGIGSLAPSLMSPYNSNGANIGIGLGSALLAGILGHYAKQSAAEDTARLFGLSRDYNKADEATRKQMILDEPLLANYGATRTTIEDQNRMDLANKMQELQLGNTFDIAKYAAMTPLEIQRAGGIEGAKFQAQDSFGGASSDREKSIDNIRNTFAKLPEVVDFVTVEKAAKSLQGALKDKGAPSDLELVRYSIQMIEPGMAVREGEQAAVMNSASIPQAWKGQIEKTITGGTALKQDVREGLQRLGARAYESNKQAYDRALMNFQKEAEYKRINPNRVSYIGEALPTEKIFTPLDTSSPAPLSGTRTGTLNGRTVIIK